MTALGYEIWEWVKSTQIRLIVLKRDPNSFLPIFVPSKDRRFTHLTAREKPSAQPVVPQSASWGKPFFSINDYLVCGSFLWQLEESKKSPKVRTIVAPCVHSLDPVL